MLVQHAPGRPVLVGANTDVHGLVASLQERLVPVQGPAGVDQSLWTGLLTSGLRSLRVTGWR